MDVMIGIDPHKGSHTAVVVDQDEVVIDEIRVKATANQLGELQEWASGHDDRCWAVESARGMGYLLAQQLVGAGERVIDVPAMMASRVRLLGSGRSQKNDPNDARSVAIAALRHPGLAMVGGDDHTRVLGLLAKRHRDVARLKNKAACRLHALLAELTPGGLATEMTVNKANLVLAGVEVSDEVTRQRVVIATELVDDIGRFEAQMRASKKRIRAAVAASGTSLTNIRGVGPIGAAIILGSVGDVARFPTPGHFASYNATAPIEASSGDKTRHRLNPRGNRKLNHALHIAAVTQLRYPNKGRDYYDKKRAEGKTSKEAIRALKRRISDVVYRHLIADTRHHIN
jgi:transposase